MTPSNAPCPCCGYRTLGTRGTQEVCPVCLWEDDLPDGPDADELEPEDAHNANGMCLFDARANLVAWGAIRPGLVHRSRPPRPDEAPEGTTIPDERPYDRWPTLEVGLGVHFGWIGPPPEDDDIRDGFLVLDDGRRAGLHVRAVPHALAPRIEPDDPGPGRNGQFEVWIPGREVDTDGVLALLGAGLAAQIVALLGDGRAAAPWVPRRQYLESFRSSGSWGHRETRWEASPDDIDRVLAWAETEIRRDIRTGDRFYKGRPRSFSVQRSTPEGSTGRHVDVYDVTVPLPPESPSAWPAGTRCLLAWSTGLSLPPPRPPFPPSSSSDSYPIGPPPIIAPPIPPRPPRRRFWRRG